MKHPGLCFACSLVLPLLLVGCDSGAPAGSSAGSAEAPRVAQKGRPEAPVPQVISTTRSRPTELQRRPSVQPARPSRALPSGLFLPLPPVPGGASARHALTESGVGLIMSGGAGADGALDRLLLFDAFEGRFVALKVGLHEPRFGHTATRVSGRDGRLGTPDDGVLVIGGFDGQKAIIGVELVLPDPNGDGRIDDAQVLRLTGLDFGLADHRTIGVQASGEGDAVLVVGGLAFGARVGSEPAVSSAALLYRVERGARGGLAGRLEPIAQPAFARRGHSLSLLAGADRRVGTEDDLVVAVGGRGLPSSAAGEAQIEPIAAPEIYDPKLDRWTTVAVYGRDAGLQARFDHRCWAVGDELILIGGGGAEGPFLEAARLCFDARNMAVVDVSAAGTMERGRHHPEVALIDGSLLVTGGYDELLGSVLDSAELFDLDTGRFEPLEARLASPRLFHAVANFAGRVIVTGGYARPGMLEAPTAEFFAPSPRP